MGKPKILITDYVHQVLITRLIAEGFSVDYLPNINYNQFLAVVRNYRGLVINSKIKMNKSAITRTKNCAFIARLGSGLDIIDLQEASKHNIQVFSAPEGNRNAVAEHAVGMILSLFNNLMPAHQGVKNFQWNREENRGTEIEGMTIGVIGFGNTGSSFAKKWAGWDVRVLAYDKYKSDYLQGFSHIEEVDLDYLLQESDVVSIHLQLTDETLGMVNADFIAKMKKGAILVNTSRGKIVNTEELLKALKSNYLSGACLDVLEQERIKMLNIDQKTLYKSLFAMENVMISPHIAGWSHQSLKKIANVLADKIINKV
jgi:D-3-phosphoglycerate dehydrogenase